jgi:hypothetical protein
MPTSSDRLYDVWETNYGRDCGWVVEKDGKVVALLVNGTCMEMFWDEYDVIAVCDENENGDRVFTKEFWDSFCSDTFRVRSYEFLDEVPTFPGGISRSQVDKVSMHALYIHIGEPGILDWMVLNFRRRFGKQFKSTELKEKLAGRNRIQRSELSHRFTQPPSPRS